MEREPDCWVNVYDRPVYSMRGCKPIGSNATTAKSSDHFAEVLSPDVRRLYRLRIYLKSPPDPNTEE